VEGDRALERGEYKEALLAYEAAVQQKADDPESWLKLGLAQAENDDDVKAIAALQKCLSIDEAAEGTSNKFSQDALLALGVSYTNELHESKAVEYLTRWLENHPNYSIPSPANTISDEPVLQNLTARFRLASETNSADPELHIALGVLRSLAKDFDQASASFRLAVRHNPADHQVWNKLGATLSNGSNAKEALRAYRKAIEIKPKYVRAWVNVGTAYANELSYEQAIKYYLKGLEMNGEATHIWSYVRNGLLALGRDDLLECVHAQDLARMREAFPG